MGDSYNSGRAAPKQQSQQLTPTLSEANRRKQGSLDVGGGAGGIGFPSSGPLHHQAKSSIAGTSSINSFSGVSRQIAEEFSQSHNALKAAIAKSSVASTTQQRNGIGSAMHQRSLASQNFSKKGEKQSLIHIGQHIPNNKSITSQSSNTNSIGSSNYRPSSIINQQLQREISKKTDASSRANYSNPVNSVTDIRSKSISSQIESGGYADPAQIFLAMSQPEKSHYHQLSVQNTPSGSHYQASPQLYQSQPQQFKRDWQNQEMNYRLVKSDPNFNLEESSNSDIQNSSESPYYMINQDFEQQAIERAKRIDSLGRQHPQYVENGIRSGSIGPQVYIPYQQPSLHGQQPQYLNANQVQSQMLNPYYLNQFQLAPTTALIQPIVIQQNPSFHHNNNQQYYTNQYPQDLNMQTPPHAGSHFLNGYGMNGLTEIHSQPNLNTCPSVISPSHNLQQQQMLKSYQNTEIGTPSTLPAQSLLDNGSSIHKQESAQTSSFQPFTTTCQQLMQNSHCSSSGNISSSWLSQSQSSQNQVTPNSSQALTSQQQQSPCQCANCLKAQMAQLQQLLQHQQQLFFQQTNALPLQQPPVQPQTQSIQYKQQSKLVQQVQPSQPSGHHQPPPSFCSNMTLGAANNNNNGTHIGNNSSSLIQNQSSSVWASSTSQISPQSQSITKSNVVEQSASPAHSQASSNMRRPSMQSGVQAQAKVDSPQKPHSSNAMPMMLHQESVQTYKIVDHLVALNEGDRKQQLSETESIESGSIPDEIEQQQIRSFNDKTYQEEIPIVSQNNFPLILAGQLIANDMMAFNEKEKTTQTKYIGPRFSPNGNEEEDHEVGERNLHSQGGSYWAPDQIGSQNNQMTSVAIAKKNYIELPLGEIPEMKESFYDEASRWSQVFATANQSRNKTPDAMLSHHSQKNLHSDKIMNSNSRQQPSQTSQISSRLHPEEEDEKDELFLYSQGESGATLNRTDNDSSFLTSEKGKFNQCLQNDFNSSLMDSNQQLVGHLAQKRKAEEGKVVSSQSPSFDDHNIINSMNSKSMECEKEQRLKIQQIVEPMTIKKNLEETIGERKATNGDLMQYPSSTDTKRPPLEYSASSAKYMNQSLTLTPSQKNGSSSSSSSSGEHDEYQEIKESDMRANQQQISKMLITRYEQLTPEPSSKKWRQGDDKHSDRIELFSKSRGRMNFDTAHCLTEEEQINAQREVLLSPLPPLPYATEVSETPERKPQQNQKPQIQIISQDVISRNTSSRIGMTVISQGYGGHHAHSYSRVGSDSYEKEKANKIINYILNSDQKGSHHQAKKSSFISRTGFHRPNVMSQVHNIFPNLDELLIDQEKQSTQGLRNRQNLQSIQFTLEGGDSQHLVQSLNTVTAGDEKRQTMDEELMWSASVDNKSDAPTLEEATNVAGFSINHDFNNQASARVFFTSESTPDSGLNSVKKLSSSMSRAIPSLKLKDIQPKVKSGVLNQWQSRNNHQASNVGGGGARTNTSMNSNGEMVSQIVNSLEISQGNERKGSQSDNTRRKQTEERSTSGNRIQNKSARSPFNNQGKIFSSRQISIVAMNSINNGKSSNTLSPYFGDKAKFISAKNGNSAKVNSAINNNSKNQVVIKRPLFNQNNLSNTSLPKYYSQSSSQASNLQKSSPSVFDRLSKQQVIFGSVQKPFDIPPITTVEEYSKFQPPSVLANNNILYQTARDTSAKSRPSLERERHFGARGSGDTRKSSCSSGTQSGGPRKRKFSKIIFEISELPNALAVNRSLSNTRQQDNSLVRTSFPVATAAAAASTTTQSSRMAVASILHGGSTTATQALVHRKLEHPLGIANRNGSNQSKRNLVGLFSKTSLSPMKNDSLKKQLSDSQQNAVTENTTTANRGYVGTQVQGYIKFTNNYLKSQGKAPVVITKKYK